MLKYVFRFQQQDDVAPRKNDCREIQGRRNDTSSCVANCGKL